MVIDSITLTRVTKIRDLGIIFDQNMSFARYVDFVSKAYSMLGFMMIIFLELYDP